MIRQFNGGEDRFERAAVGRYLKVLADFPLYSGDQMYPACTYNIA